MQGLAKKQLAAELSGRINEEDISQSVFRTLFRRLQAGEFSVPEGATIWRLMATIAVNKVRKKGAYHRAAKRDIRKTAQVDAELLQVWQRDQSLVLSELRLTIVELLKDYDEPQRKIVELRLDGEEVQAIATKLSRSKRTIERTLQGFRQRLQRALDGDD